MVFLLDFYDILVRLPWDLYWIPLGFPDSQKISMLFLWDSYGAPLAFLWDFHDMSMIFLWNYSRI